MLCDADKKLSLESMFCSASIAAIWLANKQAVCLVKIISVTSHHSSCNAQYKKFQIWLVSDVWWFVGDEVNFLFIVCDMFNVDLKRGKNTWNKMGVATSVPLTTEWGSH